MILPDCCRGVREMLLRYEMPPSTIPYRRRRKRMVTKIIIVAVVAAAVIIKKRKG